MLSLYILMKCTCQVLIRTPARVFCIEISSTMISETHATLLSFPSPPMLWSQTKTNTKNKKQKISKNWKSNIVNTKWKFTIIYINLMPWPGPQLMWWIWTLEEPVWMDTQSSPVYKKMLVKNDLNRKFKS